MLLIVVFILGMLVATGAIAGGMYLSTRTGEHFVNTYVKKLTPESMKAIQESTKEYIPEENLRALDVDEDQYKRIMGWKEDEPNANY